MNTLVDATYRIVIFELAVAPPPSVGVGLGLPVAVGVGVGLGEAGHMGGGAPGMVHGVGELVGLGLVEVGVGVAWANALIPNGRVPPHMLITAKDIALMANKESRASHLFSIVSIAP